MGRINNNGTVDRGILEILKTKVQAESDYDAVSPLSLELYAHARIFECSAAPDFNLFGPIIGRNLKLAKQWMSQDGLITLLLTVDNEPPSWATSDVLINIRHDAFLLAYNAATRLCFIGSTRRTDRLYIEMMQVVCRDQHRPISYESTRRAVAGLKDLKFYNLGLKNTAINTQAESYRVLTGPRAERAVTAGDARMSRGTFSAAAQMVRTERQLVRAAALAFGVISVLLFLNIWVGFQSSIVDSIVLLVSQLRVLILYSTPAPFARCRRW
jgi:hypothetical protein